MAKQREQESALERVKRQQQELDEMRLKYTIYNEEKIAKTEQSELQVSYTHFFLLYQLNVFASVNSYSPVLIIGTLIIGTKREKN